MGKFQVKTRYKGDYHDIDDLILKRSGIIGEKRDFFLNPDHSKDYPFEPMDFQEGKELLQYHIKNNSKIGLLIDPDVDGYTSGAILYKYLKSKDITPHTYQQKGKEHGLTDYIVESVLRDELDLLIAADSSTNDIEQQNKLLIKTDLLIIDHHQIEDDDWYKRKKPPIINNFRKDNFKPINQELTGVGMVLRFLEKIENRYLYEYYDLAMLGQIGDNSDVANPEIRNIVIKGMSQIREEKTLIAYILEKELGTKAKFTPRDIPFKVNPLINAMVRVGKEDEKKTAFQALVENNEDYEKIYKLLTKVKRRQKRIVDKMKKDLVNNMYSDGGVAVGYVENPEDKTVVGLVAGQLVHTLNKPVLLLRDKDKDALSGSGRGLEKVIPSLKDWCEDTGVVTYVGGHDNAFGLGLEKEEWSNLLQKTQEVKQLDYIYEVDNVHEDIDRDIIKEYHSAGQYVGGSVEEVKICLSSIEINKDKMLARGSVSLLFYDDVEFIIFNDNGITIERLKQGFGDTVKLDIVGKPNINQWWTGKKYQIIVEDLQYANGDLLFEDVKLPKRKLDPNMVIF